MKITPKAIAREATIGIWKHTFQTESPCACTPTHAVIYESPVSIDICCPWRSCHIYIPPYGRSWEPHLLPLSGCKREQKAMARLNKPLMSLIKAPRDGAMVLTIDTVKNFTSQAAGSEFTCR